MIEQIVLLFNMAFNGDFAIRQEIDPISKYPIVNTCKMQEAYSACIDSIDDVRRVEICRRSSYEYVETLSLMERKKDRDYPKYCYKAAK